MRATLPSYADMKAMIAVVSGGSLGIGVSACRLLAGNDARVAVRDVA